MFHFSPKVTSMLTIATALCLAAACQAQTQMQAKVVLASSPTSSRTTNSIVSSPSTTSTLHHGIAPRLISARVDDGILTIDGMVAKIRLNYQIRRTDYMYFFVPGVGTAVVSMNPMAGAVLEADAFEGSRLTFVAGGHTFELTGKKALLTRDKDKTNVYVRLDTSTVALGRYPFMGYGDIAQAPYVWPLSDVSTADTDAHVVAPPPMPESVLPRTVATELPVSMQ